MKEENTHERVLGCLIASANSETRGIARTIPIDGLDTTESINEILVRMKTILHKDKFSRGKGLFTPVDYAGAKELPDDEYPLKHTTGRVLYNFHTKKMTGKNY